MSARLSKKFIEALKGKKNLLAFSAGVDSSALFFMLLQENIPFDVACVNYQTRQNSSLEAINVKNLAKKHNKKAYIFTCKLQNSNFEHNARKIRYDFFEDIISKHYYENLLLAHQLDDRFEWFLMQTCKGAGASELAGFSPVEKRKKYTLLRPLYKHTKEELKGYLDANDLPYFEDESNFDTKYKRNFFRQSISSKLLSSYRQGISKTLDFILEDSKVLKGEYCLIKDEFYMYKLSQDEINIRLIDKAIKELGFVMSEKTRLEALKKNAVISRKVAVGKNESYGFIAPFVKVKMEKEFKEKCRILKIPKHIRGYLHVNKDIFEKIIKEIV